MTRTSTQERQREREQLRERIELRAAHRRRLARVRVVGALLGWTTAAGATVVLTGLIVETTAALGSVASTGRADHAVTVGSGVVGVAVQMLVLFVSYFCGGVVAGRMARSAGLTQGLAVGVWGVAITTALVAVGLAGGSRFDLITHLGTLPTISLSGDGAAGGLVAVLGVTAAAVLGALLGGVAGVRWQRRADADDAAAADWSPDTFPRGDHPGDPHREDSP